MAHSYDFHKFSKFSYAVLSGIGMEYQTSHMLLLRRELFTNKQDRETLDSCAKLIIHNYRALSLSDSCLVRLRLPVVPIPSTSSCFNKI